MGIKGLLPAVKDTAESCHVGVFKGKTVGVDGYVWLHRACVNCAYELCVGLRTKSYITYFLSRVQMLLDAGVTPIVVLDGADMPLKDSTNDARHKRREASHQKAKACLEKGDKLQAAQHYASAFDITPDLAQSVAQVLRNNGIQTVIAPYEADGQLAYLAKTGKIHAAITEDSDLIAHGVRRVFTKMDNTGMGELYTIEKVIPAALGLDSTAAGVTPESHYEKFLMHCILCGCDYLSNLKGLGQKKAAELARGASTIDEALTCFAMTTAGASLTRQEIGQYKCGYLKSLFVFKHQRVIDPATKKLETATPLGGSCELRSFVEQHVEGGIDKLIGPEWGQGVVSGVIELRIDPTTLATYEGKYNDNVDLSFKLRNKASSMKQMTLFDCMKVAKKEAPKAQGGAKATPKRPKAASAQTVPAKQQSVSRNPFTLMQKNSNSQRPAKSSAVTPDAPKTPRVADPVTPGAEGSPAVCLDAEPVDCNEVSAVPNTYYVSGHFVQCHAEERDTTTEGGHLCVLFERRSEIRTSDVVTVSGKHFTEVFLPCVSTPHAPESDNKLKRKRTITFTTGEELDAEAAAARLRLLETVAPDDDGVSISRSSLGKHCSEDGCASPESSSADCDDESCGGVPDLPEDAARASPTHIQPEPEPEPEVAAADLQAADREPSESYAEPVPQNATAPAAAAGGSNPFAKFLLAKKQRLGL
eukprot:TRINITY_DN27016_c0_g1_i1.p1 TRINITY_DN27016_c0_g1~~TRINITY_DN27016_c0_g1_i1.p1  ORF type:complete len:713 (+),score=184.36 TRINITY_DN27016_c0_g1_i1:37-2139(+)